jgi:hypothetical protein
VGTLLLQVLTGLGAASIGGDSEAAATSAVTFRGCAVLIMVSLVTAVVTARGLRSATRSTLAAVATGALVAYLVLATLSPGHVTLARLISDATAICLITEGVLFLAAALSASGSRSGGTARPDLSCNNRHRPHRGLDLQAPIHTPDPPSAPVPAVFMIPRM